MDNGSPMGRPNTMDFVENLKPGTSVNDVPRADWDKAKLKYNDFYRGPDFYKTSYANKHKDFVTAMDAISSEHDLASALIHMMNVAPVVRVSFDDPETDQVSSLIGSAPAGFYSPWQSKVALNKENSDGVRMFSNLTTKDLAYMKRKIKLGEKDKLPDHMKKAIDGLHTVVHELVHAKDRYLDEQKDNRSNSNPNGDPVKYARRDSPIMEALTELKAQEIVNELLMGDSTHNHVYPYGGSYREYCYSMMDLENDQPGIREKLWNTQNQDERVNIVNEAIENAITPVLHKMEEEGKEEMVDMFMTWMQDALPDQYTRHLNPSQAAGNLGPDGDHHDKLFSLGIFPYVHRGLCKAASAKGYGQMRLSKPSNEELKQRLNKVLFAPTRSEMGWAASSSFW
jgi:hypothetical protein